MSQLFVDNIKGRTGGAIGAPSGAVVTGVTTATGLDVNGNADISGTLAVGGNVSVGGTLTYEDVTNIDAVGIITAQQGIRIGTGGTIGPVGSGIVTYFGDGSNLTGVVSGIEVKSSNTSVGTSLTALNFTGATVTASQSAGISTIAIAAAGISSAQSSPSAKHCNYIESWVCTTS